MSSQASLIPEAEPGDLFRLMVDQRLSEIFDQQMRTASSLPMNRLWEQIFSAVQGGKRTRPMLVSLGHQAFGGENGSRVVDVGCAFELLHTALVIHDDVIDQDFVRRGRPTLSAHYRDCAAGRGENSHSAEHVGNSVAILAGDILISQAVRLVHGACEGLSCATRVIDAFHEAILQSAAGELDDVLFSAGMEPPGLDDVLRMHRLKTAAYSFEAPLRAGALLAGAPDDLMGQLVNVGSRMGSCYQIIDDVLGTFGDSSATGKPTDSDLREGKFTVLIALAESVPGAAPMIREWRSGELNHESMRALLTQHDIENRARSLAEGCCAEARNELDELPIRDDVRETFHLFIDDLLQRRV